VVGAPVSSVTLVVCSAALEKHIAVVFHQRSKGSAPSFLVSFGKLLHLGVKQAMRSGWAEIIHRVGEPTPHDLWQCRVRLRTDNLRPTLERGVSSVVVVIGALSRLPHVAEGHRGKMPLPNPTWRWIPFDISLRGRPWGG